MSTVIVDLDGGLNDTGKRSSRSLEGSVKESLNYERGIDEGYTRISGFARWDGRPYVIRSGFDFYVDTASASPGLTLNEIGTVTYADDLTGNAETVSAIVTSVGAVTQISDDPIYRHTGTAAVLSPINCESPGNIAGFAVALGAGESSSTAWDTSEYSGYSSLVDPLPTGTIGKIAGAHVFRNRVYAIADYACIRLNNVTTLNLKEGAVVTNTTPAPDVTLGTLVGFQSVSGDPQAGTAVVDLILRNYGGTAPSVGDDIEVQGNTGKVGDFASFQQSPRAGLFYADYNGAGGWNEVSPGRRFRYKVDSSCTGTPFTSYTRSGFATDVTPLSSANLTYQPDSIGAQYGGWISSSSGIQPPLVADIQTSGGDAIFAGLGTGSGFSTGEFTAVFGTNVAATLPAGAVVVGIEVTIRRANSAAVGTIRDQKVQLTGLAGPPGENKADLAAVWPLNLVYADKVYGGPLDTWGHTIRTEDITSTSFGVTISAQQFPTTNICIAYIDQVSLKIYYREQTQDIYIWSGSADVEQVKVIHHTVSQGTFNGKDAEGSLVVTDMASVYARSSNIGIGYQLRTGAAGGGALLGYYNSVDEPLTLPSSSILEEAGTRWTFTTCDPWAVDASDIMVACSGVEEAYGFDGDYLLPIATGLKPVEEIPRHAAYFQNQLFFGYAIGIVQASDVGQILKFSGGEAGAIENGVSDRVTGLLPLKGQALAVFTERSIRAIYADGAGVQDIKSISDSSGAIEYTVQDMGVPMFCDFRGIATLSAVQEYGDFQRGRLTNKVTRYMLSRLQFETANQTVDKRPIAAVAIRNKNQYRVFFRDGYFATLTLAGDAIDPQVMACRYFIDGSNTIEKAVKVLALCSGVTNEGRDVAFFSVDNQSDMYRYMYRIDIGRSFDGDPVVAYLSLNPIWGGPPGMTRRWDRMSVYGKSSGSVALTAKFAKNFAAPSSYSRAFTFGSGDAGDEPDDVMATVEIGQDARCLMLRFDSSSATEQPHTLQMIDFTVNETNEKAR